MNVYRLFLLTTYRIIISLKMTTKPVSVVVENMLTCQWHTNCKEYAVICHPKIVTYKIKANDLPKRVSWFSRSTLLYFETIKKLPHILIKIRFTIFIIAVTIMFFYVKWMDKYFVHSYAVWFSLHIEMLIVIVLFCLLKKNTFWRSEFKFLKRTKTDVEKK